MRRRAVKPKEGIQERIFLHAVESLTLVSPSGKWFTLSAADWIELVDEVVTSTRARASDEVHQSEIPWEEGGEGQ